MTHFEYLSVAFSIVLSLAAVRLLSGLSLAFVRERRYLPHALWLVFTLLACAMVWWNFWSFRETEWNFLTFLLILTIPAVMYLMAAALVPEQPATVVSWEEHFRAVRARFFGALSTYFALVITVTWLMIDFPLLHPARFAHGLAVALALAGALSANRRLHTILPIIFLAILSVAATVLFIRPDAVTGPP